MSSGGNFVLLPATSSFCTKKNIKVHSASPKSRSQGFRKRKAYIVSQEITCSVLGLLKYHKSLKILKDTRLHKGSAAEAQEEPLNTPLHRRWIITRLPCCGACVCETAQWHHSLIQNTASTAGAASSLFFHW